MKDMEETTGIKPIFHPINIFIILVGLSAGFIAIYKYLLT